MTIGDRIKKRRMQLDMSADELADELGKSRATIYRYENGDIKNLPTTILEPLAQALYTTPAYLMGWTDDPSNWEDIANESGICQPNDADIAPEDWYKMKIASEEDRIINVNETIKSDDFHALIEKYYDEILSKLDGASMEKVIKYSQNILNIQEAEAEQQHLIPNAAHKRTDLTKEELNDEARNKHDDDIMNDLNF